MSDTTFDPDVFLSTEVEGELSTTYLPVPEGEYVASIDDIKIKSPKGSVILEVLWDLQDNEVKEIMSMDKVVVRQSIFLDVEEETGALSLGENKNVRLGRLRENLGQNTPGQPWSFLSLKGAGPVTVTVSQRPSTKEGEDDVIYNDIIKVTPLG